MKLRVASCLNFSQLSYVKNGKIGFPFSETFTNAAYNTLFCGSWYLKVPQMTPKEYDNATKKQLEGQLNAAIRHDWPLEFTPQSDCLLYSYMLLDAMFEAMREYVKTSQGYINCLPKDYTNSTAMQLYENDSFLDTDEIPIIRFQTSKERLGDISYELKDFFSSSTRIRSSKLKNVLEYVASIFKIIVTRSGKGLIYGHSLDNEDKFYKQKNSPIFKDLFLLYLANEIIPIIVIINKDKYSLASKYLFTSIYHTGSKESTIPYNIENAVDDWKKLILKYFEEQNTPILESSFFESLSVNFPISITPVFLYMAKLFQEAILEINYHLTKRKGVKKKIAFGEDNIFDNTDDLEQWLLDDNDYELSDEYLINNKVHPIVKTKFQ